MIEKFKRWLVEVDIENRLFQVALIVATPYFGSSIFFDITHEAPLTFTILDSALLGMCLLFLYLSKYLKIVNVLINIFCVMIMGGFTFYWSIYGGIVGGGAYIFPVVCVLIILMTRNQFRKIFTSLLIVLTFIIVSDVLEVTGEVEYNGLLFDFILNMVILALLLIIFKLSLDQERANIEEQNQKINEVNEELSKKTQELENYNKEVKLIKKNLESIVHQRTEKLEEENRRDIEYAFINAHLVRAPIANIIGLSEMLSEEYPEMKELQRNVSELDGIVRKIGDVLTEH